MKNHTIFRAGLGLAGLALVAAHAGAQEADVAKQIEELQRGQEQIRKELAEIKRLLQAAPRAAQPRQGSAVAGKIFEIADNPVKGESTAKLTLVEFSDYQ